MMKSYMYKNIELIYPEEMDKLWVIKLAREFTDDIYFKETRFSNSTKTEIEGLYFLSKDFSHLWIKPFNTSKITGHLDFFYNELCGTGKLHQVQVSENDFTTYRTYPRGRVFFRTELSKDFLKINRTFLVAGGKDWLTMGLAKEIAKQFGYNPTKQYINIIYLVEDYRIDKTKEAVEPLTYISRIQFVNGYTITKNVHVIGDSSH